MRQLAPIIACYIIFRQSIQPIDKHLADDLLSIEYIN